MFRKKNRYTLNHDFTKDTPATMEVPVATPPGTNNRSTKEEYAVLKFRESLGSDLKPNHDDIYIRKWLKARNFDVNKAMEMYRASMLFRDRIEADKLLENYEPPEVIEKYLTGGFVGYDKEGSPLKVELFGHLDIKGLMYSAKKSDLEKAKMYECERAAAMCCAQSEKLGKKIDSMTVIFDMESVGTKALWKPGLQMYLHLVKILEDNYPEMLKRLLVINAPAIFPILYKLVRPLISDDMRQKIHVMGANFKALLRQHIEDDQLPAYLGGTLTDADGNPRCASMIGQGGTVPESYLEHNDKLAENMTAVVVAKKLELKFKVDIPGMILRWEFKTDGYDIGFGVMMDNSVTGTRQEVVAMDRVNSHMVPEDGTLVCKDSGTYIVCFDNSFSWARSKKLFYDVELFEAEVGEDIKSQIQEHLEDMTYTELAESH